MQHSIYSYTYSSVGMCYDAYVCAAQRWRMSAAYESTRTISNCFYVVTPSTPLLASSTISHRVVTPYVALLSGRIVATAVIELIISLVI